MKTPKWDKILLRHLLTMTPGIDWNEDTAWMDPYNTGRAMYEAADPYPYILGREVLYEPDAKWQYNTGATELLGAVLKKATGSPRICRSAFISDIDRMLNVATGCRRRFAFPPMRRTHAA